MSANEFFNYMANKALFESDEDRMLLNEAFEKGQIKYDLGAKCFEMPAIPSNLAVIAFFSEVYLGMNDY